jgi:hypothetical protein
MKCPDPPMAHGNLLQSVSEGKPKPPIAQNTVLGESGESGVGNDAR